VCAGALAASGDECLNINWFLSSEDAFERLNRKERNTTVSDLIVLLME
jgi:hypothetical protein